MGNKDPQSKLASREEWQTNVRERFPFADPESPIQEVYDTTNYIDEAAAEHAINQAMISQAVKRIRYNDSYRSMSFTDALEAIQADEEQMGNLGRIVLYIDRRLATSKYLESTLNNTKYLEGLQEAVKAGMLSSEDAERHLRARLQTRVRTVSPSIARTAEVSGHYDSNRDEIVAYDSAIDYPLGKRQRIATVAHEYGHKESGGTFIRYPDGSIHRARVGFVNIKNPHLAPPNNGIVMHGKVGWNEAANEHKIRGVLSADFEHIDPDRRTGEEKIYLEYRKVLADVYQKGGKDMKVGTLIAGLNEDTGPGGGFSARRALIQEINAVYGWGAMRKIEKLMQSAEQEPDKVDDILACIHPPERDEAGKIIKLGFIDEFEDVTTRLLREQSVIQEQAPNN